MKKVIGLLLCVVLVISSVGVGVYAAEPPPYSELPAEGVIVILPRDTDAGFSRENPLQDDVNNWQPSVNAQSYGGGEIGHWTSYNTLLGAVYTPTIPTGGGEYEIYAFVPHVNTGNMSATVTHVGGNGGVQYYTSASSSAQKWCLIGTYMLEEGMGASVRLNATSAHSSGTYGRMDAVAFVRVGEFVEPPVEIIIAYGDDGYLESDGVTWTDSTSDKPYGAKYRYPATSFPLEDGANVSYTPSLEAGRYEVYTWIPIIRVSAHMKAAIYHKDGCSEIKYDVANSTENYGEWYYLGTYNFSSGTEGKVILSAYVDSVLRMDAVRFLKTGGEHLEGLELFVDPRNGDDENDGTINYPFKNLVTAKKAAEGQYVKNGITVNLRAGTYYFNEALEFNPRDSGLGGPVVYKNYNNERVVFSGAEALSAPFEVYQDDIYYAYIGKNKSFRQFYVNGKSAIRARTPNIDILDMTDYPTLSSASNVSGGYGINADHAPATVIPNELELVVMSEWLQRRMLVADISPEGIVTISDEGRNALAFNNYNSGRNIARGDRYWMENSLEFLDESGEWYYNESTGYLYYMPRDGENLTESKCVIPSAVDTFIKINGTTAIPTYPAVYPVENLMFSGIVFEYSNWTRPNELGFVALQGNTLIPSDISAAADTEYRHNLKKDFVNGAFEGTYCNNLSVTDCIFRNLGGSGLFLNMGGENIRIENNIFIDIASSAIQIGEDYSNALHPSRFHKDVTIANNSIANISTDYWGGPAIIVKYIDGVLIEQNTIKNVPYSGISAGWGWGDHEFVAQARNYTIRKNYIESAMNRMRDGGAIYIPNWLYGNNLIEENYIKGSPKDINTDGLAGTMLVAGIYHDAFGGNVTNNKNVIEGFLRPFYIQYQGALATDITLTDNCVSPYDINIVRDVGTELLDRNITIEGTLIKDDLNDAWIDEATQVIKNAGCDKYILNSLTYSGSEATVGVTNKTSDGINGILMIAGYTAEKQQLMFIEICDVELKAFDRTDFLLPLVDDAEAAYVSAMLWKDLNNIEQYCKSVSINASVVE